MQEQRGKFEVFVAAQREHLRAQTTKVNQLLEDVQERAAWHAKQEEASGSRPNQVGAFGDGVAKGTGPLYRRPLGAAMTVLASKQGRALLRRAGQRSEEMALCVLQTAPDPYAGGPGRHPDVRRNPSVDVNTGALVAMAAALNALDLEQDILWEGPWRWQSAELLRMALPAIVSDPASPALGFPALAALATTCGADAQAWQGDQVGVDLVRSQLERLLGLASNAEHEVRGVLVAALMWRIGVVGGGLRPDEGTAAKEERVRVWATLCGWERETEMVLIVPHWSALRLPAAWCSLSDICQAVAGGVVESRGEGTGGLLRLTRPARLDATAPRAGLMSVMCLRDLLPGLPPLHELVMLLESTGPKALEGCRDPGSAVSALVATAMVQGKLVHVLRQYEVAIAHARGLDEQHAGRLASAMEGLRGCALFLRVQLVLQDELVRSGIGSWRASRASAELLTFLFVACDAEVLFGHLSAGPRGEMLALHAEACSASAALEAERLIVRAFIMAALHVSPLPTAGGGKGDQMLHEGQQEIWHKGMTRVRKGRPGAN